MKLASIKHIDESGIYIPLYALALVTLVLVFGLAVDGGNLYLTQLRLQRAVDAAALSGAQLTQRMHETTDVPDPQHDADNIRSLTAHLVTSAFALSTGNAQRVERVDVGEGKECLTDPTLAPENCPQSQPTLDVNAEVNAHLYLLGAIPWVRQLQTVKAHAAATIGSNKVFTVLALDTSNSMNCSATIPPNDPATCRITHLQDAVSKFLDQQIVAGDYIAVVTFDAFARVLKDPVLILDQQSTKQEIKDEIAKLWVWKKDATGNPDPSLGVESNELHSNTNLYDGLRLSLKLIKEKESELTNISRTIALFSDGAPSLGWQECQWQPMQEPYLAFNHQVNALRFPNDCGDDVLCNQLTHISDRVLAGILGASGITPDPHSDGCPRHPMPASVEIKPNELSPDVISVLLGTQSNPESGRARWEAFRTDARPDSCDPTSEWTPNDAYHAAINISDRARLEGVLIYTFAIGQDSTPLSDIISEVVADDPYQGGYVGAVLDVVQTNFLRRIANDPGDNPDQAALNRVNFSGPCVLRYTMPFDATNASLPPAITAYRRGRFYDATWSDADPSKVSSAYSKLNDGEANMAAIMRARLVR